VFLASTDSELNRIDSEAIVEDGVLQFDGVVAPSRFGPSTLEVHGVLRVPDASVPDTSVPQGICVCGVGDYVSELWSGAKVFVQFSEPANMTLRRRTRSIGSSEMNFCQLLNQNELIAVPSSLVPSKR
jgi:hypothetical protein